MDRENSYYRDTQEPHLNSIEDLFGPINELNDFPEIPPLEEVSFECIVPDLIPQQSSSSGPASSDSKFPLTFLQNLAPPEESSAGPSSSYTPSASALVPCSPYPPKSTPSLSILPQTSIRAVPEIPHSFSRSPKPGEYCFKVNIENGSSKWKFVEEDRYLFTKRDVHIPVIFTTNEPLPYNSRVRVIAAYEILSDFEKYGSVKNTQDNCRFIESSTVPEYGSYKGHDCLIFDVKNLPLSDNQPYCVLKFTCTSSQLNDKGNKKALPLLLFFHLLIDDEEVGVDILNLKVCYCIQRDAKKTLKRPIDTDNTNNSVATASSVPSSKRHCEKNDESNFHDSLNFTNDYTPDRDGLYTFIWRGTDVNLLNVFITLKKGYELDK